MTSSLDERLAPIVLPGISFPLLVDDRREAYKAAELKSGSLLFAHVSETFGDNADPKVLLTAVP